MRISYNWLGSIVKSGKSPGQVAALLTQAGLEVGEIVPFHFLPPRLVLGKIAKSAPHPHAPQFRRAFVDVGTKKLLPIVCKTPNLLAGQKVVVAPVGTSLIIPEGKSFKVKRMEIHGVPSEGVLCIGAALGIACQTEGIITLDTKLLPGTPMSEVWQVPPDTILPLDITPNRNDAMCHLGVARDLAALFGKQLGMPNADPLIPQDNVTVQIAVQEKQAVPRYTGVAITGITIAPSPPWLQGRLRAIGCHPINNVVDITRFIMYGLGQPLHAYDLGAITKRKITLKRLPQGTPFTALNGTTYKLNGAELMICDGQGPLAMAGIIGAERGKITPATRQIFLESAYFDPISTYKTSKHHRIYTASSQRYTRGTDPAMPYIALQKAASMIVKYAQGCVASMPQDVYSTPIPPRSFAMSSDYVARVAGHKIPKEVVCNTLRNLHFTVEEKETNLTITVPSCRRHITRPIDAAGEVLRIHGFDQLVPKPPANHPIGKSLSHRTLQQAIRSELVTQGYHEIVTNSLISSAYDASPQRIRLQNPLHEQLDSLRHTLLFSGLEAIRYNQTHQQQLARCFEIGKAYTRSGEALQEHHTLALWLTADQRDSWQVQHPPHFANLYAVVRNLLAYRGIPEPIPSPDTHPHYAHCIQLKGPNTTYGLMGHVHPKLLHTFDIPAPLFFATLNLNTLLPRRALPAYQPISKYPEVTRDLSLALSKQTPFRAIRQLLEHEAIPSLRQIDLVDHYEGAPLKAGQKSYTLRCRLQSQEGTLEDRAIAQIMQQITHCLTTQLPATMRE